MIYIFQFPIDCLKIGGILYIGGNMKRFVVQDIMEEIWNDEDRPITEGLLTSKPFSSKNFMRTAFNEIIESASAQFLIEKDNMPPAEIYSASQLNYDVSDEN